MKLPMDSEAIIKVAKFQKPNMNRGCDKGVGKILHNERSQLIEIFTPHKVDFHFF